MIKTLTHYVPPLVIAALAMYFAPELKGILDTQLTRWTIKQIDASSVDVICKNSFCEVEAAVKDTSYRFLFNDRQQLSSQVAKLNKIIETWPNSKGECRAYTHQQDSVICYL